MIYPPWQHSPVHYQDEDPRPTLQDSLLVLLEFVTLIELELELLVKMEWMTGKMQSIQSKIGSSDMKEIFLVGSYAELIHFV